MMSTNILKKVEAEVVRVRELAVVCRVEGESQFATLPLGLLERAFSEAGASLSEGARFSIDVELVDSSEANTSDDISADSQTGLHSRPSQAARDACHVLCLPSAGSNGSPG